MTHQAIESARLVVNAQLIDNGFAGAVEADNLYVSTLPAEFQHDHVERGNAGDIPDVGAGDVEW